MTAETRFRLREAAKSYVSDVVDADDLVNIVDTYGFGALAGALASMMLADKVYNETLVREARKRVQEIEKSEYTLRYLTDNILRDVDC
jgi:hypothetical protein